MFGGKIYHAEPTVATGDDLHLITVNDLKIRSRTAIGLPSAHILSSKFALRPANRGEEGVWGDVWVIDLLLDCTPSSHTVQPPPSASRPADDPDIVTATYLPTVFHTVRPPALAKPS